VLVDEKSDRIEAANAVSRLLKKEKVKAIIGSATSSNTMAGSALSEKAKIPMVSPTATLPLVTQNKKYVFRVCFIDSFQGEAAARFAYQNLGARRVAVIVDRAQDYCVGLASYFKKAFTRLGGKIVSMAYCQTGDQDFSAQLTSIPASQPDLLYLPNYYAEDALIARQAQELGLNIPILSADGAQAPELITIGGKAVEGLYLLAHFAPEGAATPLAKEFMQLFKKTRHEETSGFHALGADAYFVLLVAIKRAGRTDGDAIRAALASTRGFGGVSGIIKIGPDGNAVKSAVILQVRGGQFKYLTIVKPW
ncbi:MAG: ABC transporter substrate-binding protein, partial [Deltaproteobacteria bacterium]|nr:ABC transporter substrate-binding protein [Deltaproteobacteria bacterium]